MEEKNTEAKQQEDTDIGGWLICPGCGKKGAYFKKFGQGSEVMKCRYCDYCEAYVS